EVFVGLRPLVKAIPRMGDLPSAVVIVPAHDEEAIIEATIERLTSAAAGYARVLVVADNCTDQTAQIARAAGAEVIERSDAARRGKGFALDFARRHLGANPPELVLIIDADCAIDGKSIECLVRSCAATGRPCQATNLQQAASDASPAVQLSTFAFFIKNVIRQRALQRLAGKVHLLGTGMAFPWPIFVSADLATSNIVEDLKLGQELAISGHAPVLIEQAEVWSRAETDANTISQRRRWEGGFLQNAVRVAPRIFGKALISGSSRLLWGAIDLMIPPFALLILLDFVLLLAGAAFVWLGLSQSWPLYWLCTALLLAMVALALAWILGGSRFVSLRSLVRAPLYVAWKLPMYVGLARRGAPSEWLRTER
ncbi:MAG TPA: glycosyltransferase family 2 protein, partial [Sphingomicrobium sp.]|nr:glycosyltransferase family 2 protein [Sphingomicrobium sp.]